ncbi:MAG TPA: hydrogenase maturation protease [Methanocorpusculum sp.]|nr:hydrogenase maturation protease [Methanocorpusculum sp.]
MIIIFGVGNPLHGDDGIGPAVAEQIMALDLPGVAAYNCGNAPENFTNAVKRADTLIIVDAVEMGLLAGSVRRISEKMICDMAIGTHMMALSLLVRFLMSTVDKIVIVGVQPACMSPKEELSVDIERGVAEIVRCVQEKDIERIEVLG